MHPKFCGLRLEEPSASLPSLRRFEPELSVEPAFPESWWQLLPCRDEERETMRELRSRVSGIKGYKDPVTMLRFMRARKGDVDKAEQMYVSAMAWRRAEGARSPELGFRANVLDDVLHRRLDAHWPPTALLGRDLEGDPIYWNRLGLGSTKFLAEVPSAFIERHEVYTITRILQAMEELARRQGRPVMYMTVVVDLADLGIGHLNFKAFPKYKALVRIMEDNFPEMIKRIVVVRAPRIADKVWSIASKFFDEGTRSKIQISDARRTLEVLTKFIDRKWIPEALGGSHRLCGSPYCEPAIPGTSMGPVPRALMEDLHTFAQELG